MTITGPDPRGVTSGGRAPVTAALSLVAAWAFALDARSLAGGRPQHDPSAWIGGLCSVGGAAICAWFAVAVLACWCARAGGRLGRVGRSAARRVAPGSIGRLLATLLGTALVAPSVLDLAGAESTAPAAALLTHAAAGRDATPDTRRRLTDQPSPWPDPGFGPSPAPRVVVRPGDTLWALAEADLPAPAPARAIAAEWPRWHEANRAIIANPHLIFPGQALSRPSRATPQDAHPSPAAHAVTASDTPSPADASERSTP